MQLIVIFANALLMRAFMRFQNSAETRLSAVKRAGLPVYSQAFLESPLGRTLHQGDRVIVTGEARSRMRHGTFGYSVGGSSFRISASPSGI